MKFSGFDIKALLCLFAILSVFVDAPMVYPASLGAELLPFKGQVEGQDLQALQVGRLREKGPAAKGGLRTGDLITTLNITLQKGEDLYVSTVSQVGRLLKGRESGGQIFIRAIDSVSGQNLSFFVTLDLSPKQFQLVQIFRNLSSQDSLDATLIAESQLTKPKDKEREESQKKEVTNNSPLTPGENFFQNLLKYPDGNLSWPEWFPLTPVYKNGLPIIVEVMGSKENNSTMYSLWHSKKQNLFLLTRNQLEEVFSDYMALYYWPQEESYYTDEQRWVNEKTGDIIKSDVEKIYYYPNTGKIIDSQNVRLIKEELVGPNGELLRVVYANKSAISDGKVDAGDINDLRSQGYELKYRFARPWLDNPETLALREATSELGKIITRKGIIRQRFRSGQANFRVSEHFVRSQNTPISFYHSRPKVVIKEAKLCEVRRPEAKNPHVEFPSMLNLDAMVADFMVGKFVPKSISGDLLLGIFSSRWSHERKYHKQLKAPSRYFNDCALALKESAGGARVLSRSKNSMGGQDIPPLTQSVVEAELPQFREWFLKVSSKIPNIIKVPVSLRFIKVEGEWVPTNNFTGCGWLTEDIAFAQESVLKRDREVNFILMRKESERLKCNVRHNQAQRNVSRCKDPSWRRPIDCKAARAFDLNQCLAEVENTQMGNNWKVVHSYSDLGSHGCKGEDHYSSFRVGGSYSFGAGYIKGQKSELEFVIDLEGKYRVTDFLKGHPDLTKKSADVVSNILIKVDMGKATKALGLHIIGSFKERRFPFRFKGNISNIEFFNREK